MKTNTFITVFTCSVLLVLIGLSGCTNQQINSNDDNSDQNDQQQVPKNPEGFYQWSTMSQGPYHDSISYATSNDLLNWIDSEIILAEHASVPGAFYKKGIIHVYFVDVSTDGIAEQISLIRSKDNGQTWLDKQQVTFEDIDDKIPVDPAPILLDDERVRLYYFDINQERDPMKDSSENTIYSAISTDGVHFTQEEGIRFSHESIYDPMVLYAEGMYRMYIGDIHDNKVISATSSDGLTFVKENVAFTNGAIPEVFYKDEMYYLYTGGIDISISTNGMQFNQTSNTFKSRLGSITADPSVIELDDGTYMMFYKTK